MTNVEDLNFETLLLAVVAHKYIVLGGTCVFIRCIRKLENIQLLAAKCIAGMSETVHRVGNKRQIRLAFQALTFKIFKLECAHSALG